MWFLVKVQIVCVPEPHPYRV